MGFVPLKHQVETVFRNTQTFGGINDHMVGAGKTLVQVMTAMELRRLRTANKPLIIGLKSQVPQLYEQFRKAYPLAKVLFPTEKDFEKVNRKRLLNNIATNDWDCIILSHDQFNMIPQPLAIQEKLMTELADGLRMEISDTKGGDKQALKSLQSRLYNYEQKLERLKNTKKDDNILDFSRLGIDFLMVDESQEYKNLEFITRKRNIRGLGNPTGSKKAFNLLIACRHLQDVHDGDKGVLFCSGTPISNSMAELYLLFKYLRPNKVQELGLETFDRWAANFANDYSDMEYYMGKFKEVHRFREFANLPELVTMYREIADVRNDTNLVLDKPKALHNLVKIAPSENQLAYIGFLQRYIETKGNEYAESLGLMAGYDDRRGINPSFAILAVNFAKKLSLDPRLINPSLPAGTKIQAAADNIERIYHETGHFNGTQLMFCDIGTPKSYDALDNLYSYLEGDTSQSDLADIFNGDYQEMIKKPSLETVKANVANVLGISADDVDLLIAEANANENFSVYDELKRVLVQKGIPEEQIAFIHHYKTRKQKDSLYAAVNNGNIRIVFGSTKKLGTGVNVQQRLSALHHLDISWKPSDMEQRNGRGERQGNWAAKNYLGNTINCYYYATERTLDASMYNTVSLKAKFIAQIKTTSDVNVRSVKDIEEDVDMGGMAAELSGDPIFKERATLQKKLGDLERSNRSFLQNRYNLEDRIKREERLSADCSKRISALEKAIPLLDFMDKDKDGEVVLAGKVQKNSYSKLGAFGKAIQEEAAYLKKYSILGKPFELGTLWDFKIFGELFYSMGDKEVSRYVVTPYGDKIGSEKPLPDGEMAVAMQIRDIILSMPSELEKTKKSKVAHDDNIAEYRKQSAAENPYAKELETSRNRLNEIIVLIKERSKEEKEAAVDNQSKGQALAA